MTGLTGFGTSGVTTTAAGNFTVSGNLIVNGTTTTISNTVYETTEYVQTIDATTVRASTIGNSGATLTGTLSTAAQTNITSVGTLSSVTISGASTANSYAAVAVYAGTIGNTGATLSGGNLNIGAGVINNYKISVTGGSLSTTANSQILGQTLFCNSSNSDYLEISNTRNQAGGTDWTTAGWRLQEKIDSTWMGYIQFNTGSGTATNNGGISFGTGTSTAGPNAISERIRIDSSGHLLPAANVTYNLGSTTANWSTVYAVTFSGTSTTAKYADLAECYAADAEYEPGTVLDFGGDNEVTLSTTDGSSYVAGVVTTDPAYLMNSQLEAEHVAAIALTGRVPTKVIGPVRKGQMMVSAGNGYARAEMYPAMGSVIGKALENFGEGEGIIEVVVGRI